MDAIKYPYVDVEVVPVTSMDSAIVTVTAEL